MALQKYKFNFPHQGFPCYESEPCSPPAHCSAAGFPTALVRLGQDMESAGKYMSARRRDLGYFLGCFNKTEHYGVALRAMQPGKKFYQYTAIDEFSRSVRIIIPTFLDIYAFVDYN